MLTKPMIGLATVFVAQMSAIAGDWQYCLALSYSDHAAYFSAPFATVGSLAKAQSSFGAALDQSGRRYDDVQCPRSDNEPEIRAMRDYAVKYNRNAGNAVFAIEWQP